MAGTSELQQVRNRVDQVLATRHAELYQAVRASVAEALATDEAKIVPGASLIDDLGAESLDFLDLLFRLEKKYAIKIPRDGIVLTARQGLDGDFDRAGVLSTQALERLRLLMPEVAPERIAPGLRTHEIPSLFTVETFVRLVAWRLSDVPTT